MKKKRKTRSEKIHSEYKNRINTNAESSTLLDFSLPKKSSVSETITYSHVRSDLQKTVLITSAIVVAELVLFFVMS
jgi:BRCT domain type II-containing protein